MIFVGVTTSDLCLQSSVRQEEPNLNWDLKEADCSLFPQLAIIEETPFPTLNSMVDKFTYTVIRTSEQFIPPSNPSK
jgi:hypothetical protein